MRKLLQITLKLLSKAVIQKYRPLIVGITGSVGKTSTKEAVFFVLRKKYRVRKAAGSFNTEEGLPITILGDWSEDKLKIISKFGPPGQKIKKAFLWLKIVISGFLNFLFLPKKRYPQILVLEYGADKPGDIGRLVNLVRPQIGIVTALGEIPVHVEFYSGPEEVAKEKGKLIEALPRDGLAVLNHDDEAVFEMGDLTKTKVMTFGFAPLRGVSRREKENAQFAASDLTYYFETNGTGVRAGISFKLNYEKKVVPFRLNNALGRHQVYTALAAAAVGLNLGMNLVEISQILENFEFPKQRMRLLKSINSSWIIDDSYNASPLSTHAALDTLKDFGDKVIEKQGFGRKIAVLGDMKELGVFTEQAHRQVGNLAGERADFLFTVGPAAKFIADSAFNQIPKENIQSFDTNDEAGKFLKSFIKEGDIVLVKGSRAMEMEEVVEAIARV